MQVLQKLPLPCECQWQDATRLSCQTKYGDDFYTEIFGHDFTALAFPRFSGFFLVLKRGKKGLGFVIRRVSRGYVGRQLSLFNWVDTRIKSQRHLCRSVSSRANQKAGTEDLLFIAWKRQRQHQPCSTRGGRGGRTVPLSRPVVRDCGCMTS